MYYVTKKYDGVTHYCLGYHTFSVDKARAKQYTKDVALFMCRKFNYSLESI